MTDEELGTMIIKLLDGVEIARALDIVCVQVPERLRQGHKVNHDQVLSYEAANPPEPW
jgi:hypothetical protein